MRGAAGAALLLLALAGCAPRAPQAAPVAAAAPDTFRVRFETSEGDFVAEVVRARAPRGADRFHALVREGYYDDSRFFRVREGYIAQFGLPGVPGVGEAWRETPIPDDLVWESNRRGTLAFAMNGPDTRTTQVFLNLADNPQLDAQGFAPFGRVVEGIDVLDRLYAGHGERSGGGIRYGGQGPILREGNAWLDREFPGLTRIRRLELIR